MKETAQILLKKVPVKQLTGITGRKINFNIGKYNAVVPHGKQQFADLDLARERAKNIKWKAIETLDKQLRNI